MDIQIDDKMQNIKLRLDALKSSYDKEFNADISLLVFALNDVSGICSMSTRMNKNNMGDLLIASIEGIISLHEKEIKDENQFNEIMTAFSNVFLSYIKE